MDKEVVHSNPFSTSIDPLTYPTCPFHHQEKKSESNSRRYNSLTEKKRNTGHFDPLFPWASRKASSSFLLPLGVLDQTSYLTHL
ncbi:hypothetical protein Hanom_Chr03g00216891 [Helianthus anomalus]